MNNPLLNTGTLPSFSCIQPAHIQPAIAHIIEDNEAAIEQLLQQPAPLTWETLQVPLDALADRLHQAWSTVEHLNAVANNEALRAAYHACLPLLSDYATRLGQHPGLFTAYQQLADADTFAALDAAQQKVIHDQLRDFKLAGVALPDTEKASFRALKQRLSKLTSQFSDHVLDATMAWTQLIQEADALSGMPPSALASARQRAAAKGHARGWLLTLEAPSYLPVMTYCDNRALRQAMYTAYCTRASEQGPQAGQFDNTDLISDILTARQALAQHLGFANYAAYSLATKMAESTEQVMAFLADLANRAKPQAMRELAELQAFAKATYGVESLAAWDVAYYAEKLCQQRYALSQEALRPWFPIDQVIQGLFTITARLFAIRVEPVTQGVDTWHPAVRFYQLYRGNGQTPIGGFYLDLYAREHKRGGAWMDDCRGRHKIGQQVQRPIAYLTCNFTPPVGQQPALLTHDEVVTLFHEFGHGLHHLLTQVDYPAVAGINGVPWDAVELPSQFLENWCWEKEGLALIARHYQTGQPLPDDKREALLAARHFQAAMGMVRQLELALFDFRLHTDYTPGLSVQALLDQVRQEVAVIIPPSFNRMQHSFTHIFAGGYDAGYYSYLWAEVLSADAFARFEEEGIFNPKTGGAFLQAILEKGGSADPMTLFVHFRGRRPTIDALLRHSGIHQEPV